MSKYGTDEQLIHGLELAMAGLAIHGFSIEAVSEAIEAIRERAQWVETWEEMREEVRTASHLFFTHVDHSNLLDEMDSLDPRKVKNETV